MADGNRFARRSQPRWLQDHVAGWVQAIIDLNLRGWTAAVTCSAAPVQLEGVLPSDESFCFRARWDEVALAVSYLPAADGLALLLGLYEIFRRGDETTGLW